MSTPHTSTPQPHDPPPPRPPRRGQARAATVTVLTTVLALVLGFALTTQIRQHQSAGLQTLRQDELVRVLDDLTGRSTRLDQQVRDLQAQRDELTSGADTAAQAAEQAARRLDQLRILAGTVPATGPGIRLTITDPSSAVKASALLDTVQELRDAGAEVLQVGPVRIVASSSFVDVQGSVHVDGQPLSRPFVVLAIGETQTLASALNIPGGIVDSVRRVGASAQVETLPSVTVDARATPTPPRFARAATEPGPPGPSQ